MPRRYSKGRRRAERKDRQDIQELVQWAVGGVWSTTTAGLQKIIDDNEASGMTAQLREMFEFAERFIEQERETGDKSA